MRMTPRLFSAALIAGLSLFAAASAHAAALSTLHAFCRNGDNACLGGKFPEAPLIQDETGTLYGTATQGGDKNQGVVFSLVPDANRTNWTYKVIHDFCSRPGCRDSGPPVGALIRDTQDRLYGVTSGTIYRLTPNAGHTHWRLSLLHRFCTGTNCIEGSQPAGTLTYDGAESGAPYDGVSPLYGTAFTGGAHGKGTAFELSFPGGVPTFTVIYQFCPLSGCADGAFPVTKLTFDGSGNLYGVAFFNGGEVFKLSPAGGGSWSESVVHNFCTPACSQGLNPSSGLIRDAAGNFYGTLANTGRNPHHGGALYKMTPDGTTTVLKTFCQLSDCADGTIPRGEIVMDDAGTIYGTTERGGTEKKGGAAYSVAADGSYQVIYDFCSQSRCADGKTPYGGLILDASGHLFGMTLTGGAGPISGGTLYELTP